MVINYLVGGIPTPLKNMKVSWDYDIPNIWTNKQCSKPPTRSCLCLMVKTLDFLLVKLHFLGCFLQGATVEVLIEAGHHLRTSP